MSHTTTYEQAYNAVKTAGEKFISKNYDMDNAVSKRLVELMLEDNSVEGRRGTAAKFRMLAWDAYTGGGITAHFTWHAFDLVGRKGETDPDWS